MASDVVALLDPSDRRLAGFAAGLDSLSREVVPGLEALSRIVVTQAEQLALATTEDDSRLQPSLTSIAGDVTLARLARLHRRARRARTWSVLTVATTKAGPLPSTPSVTAWPSPCPC